MSLELEFDSTEVVYDTLTKTVTRITGIHFKNGKVIYWVDNDYFEGCRHPWEIEKIKDE